jgi:hypothetical protein
LRSSFQKTFPTRIKDPLSTSTSTDHLDIITVYCFTAVSQIKGKLKTIKVYDI